MGRTLIFNGEELNEILICLLSRYRMLTVIRGKHDNEVKTINKIMEMIRHEPDKSYE